METSLDTRNESYALHQPHIGKQQAKVLEAFKSAKEGLTDLEATDLLGIRLSSVGARRNELVAAGILVDSGVRRLSSYGKRNVVWKVAEDYRD